MATPRARNPVHPWRSRKASSTHSLVCLSTPRGALAAGEPDSGVAAWVWAGAMVGPARWHPHVAPRPGLNLRNLRPRRWTLFRARPDSSWVVRQGNRASALSPPRRNTRTTFRSSLPRHRSTTMTLRPQRAEGMAFRVRLPQRPAQAVGLHRRRRRPASIAAFGRPLIWRAAPGGLTTPIPSRTAGEAEPPNPMKPPQRPARLTHLGQVAGAFANVSMHWPPQFSPTGHGHCPW